MEDAETLTHRLDIGKAAVRRELGMRRRVYPRQVALGRMSPNDVRREINAMETVLRLLLELEHGHGSPAYRTACDAEIDAGVLS